MHHVKPLVALALLLAATVPGRVSGQTPPPLPQCEPAPAIRQALSALPDLRDYRIPYDERMKPLRDLLDRYPQDIYVQRYYQDSFKWQLHRFDEFDRAFRMCRTRPDDPVFRYLEARLTEAFHAEQAEGMLNELLVKTPGFP
jgi:hypothetical protein